MLPLRKPAMIGTANPAGSPSIATPPGAPKPPMAGGPGNTAMRAGVPNSAALPGMGAAAGMKANGITTPFANPGQAGQKPPEAIPSRPPGGYLPPYQNTPQNTTLPQVGSGGAATYTGSAGGAGGGGQPNAPRPGGPPPGSPMQGMPSQTAPGNPGSGSGAMWGNGPRELAQQQWEAAQQGIKTSSQLGANANNVMGGGGYTGQGMQQMMGGQSPFQMAGGQRPMRGAGTMMPQRGGMGSPTTGGNLGTGTGRGTNKVNASGGLPTPPRDPSKPTGQFPQGTVGPFAPSSQTNNGIPRGMGYDANSPSSPAQGGGGIVNSGPMVQQGRNTQRAPAVGNGQGPIPMSDGTISYPAAEFDPFTDTMYDPTQAEGGQAEGGYGTKSDMSGSPGGPDQLGGPRTQTPGDPTSSGGQSTQGTGSGVATGGQGQGPSGGMTLPNGSGIGGMGGAGGGSVGGAGSGSAGGTSSGGPTMPGGPGQGGTMGGSPGYPGSGGGITMPGGGGPGTGPINEGPVGQPGGYTPTGGGPTGGGGWPPNTTGGGIGGSGTQQGGGMTYDPARSVGSEGYSISSGESGGTQQSHAESQNTSQNQSTGSSLSGSNNQSSGSSSSSSDAKQTMSFDEAMRILGNGPAREANAADPFSRQQFMEEANRGNAQIAAGAQAQLADLEARARAQGMDPNSPALLAARQRILSGRAASEVANTSKLDADFRQKSGAFNQQNAAQNIQQRAQDLQKLGMNQSIINALLGQQVSGSQSQNQSLGSSFGQSQNQSTGSTQGTSFTDSSGQQWSWNRSESRWQPVFGM